MKRSRRLLALLLAVVMIVSLTACGSSKFTGTWEATLQSLTFTKDKVTVSTLGLDIATYDYKVSGDKIIISASSEGTSFKQEWTYVFNKDKSQVTITTPGLGSVVYTKAVKSK